MPLEWFFTSGSALVMVVVSTVIIYFGVILLTRIAGLRSFATISSFDFIMTIAMGSIVATTAVSRQTPLSQAVAAVGVLFLLQVAVALLRRWSVRFKWAIDNEPLLLMAGPKVLPENLKHARLTEGELLSKLREANVLDRSHVRAVVMETTGTINVLHGPDDAAMLDPWLLDGVRDGRLALRQ
ncbi:MAG: YetF domain-containing protein [Dehalococcoidia bacterium]